MNKNGIVFFIAVLFFKFSFASNMGIPVQLKLKSPNGTYPTESGVSVILQVLNNANCVLREELHSSINVVDGNLSLALGTGGLGSLDPGLTLFSVYDNSKPKSGLSCIDLTSGNVISSGQNYSPFLSDSRKLRIKVNFSADSAVATFNMKSTAYAIHAESVGGKSASDLISVNSSTQLNQANLETLLQNVTQFNNLLNVANNGVGSGGSSGVTSITAGTGLSGGTITTAGTVSLSNTAVTAGTYGTSTSVPVFTVDAQGRLTSASQLTMTPSFSAITGKSSTLTGYGITVTSSDITSALGFTPSNASSSLQSIAVSAPLSSTAGLNPTISMSQSNASTNGYLSSTDWAQFNNKLSTAVFNGYVASASCTSSQSLYWNSVTSSFACQNISFPTSAVTSVAGKTGAVTLSASDVSGLASSATLDTTNANNITSGVLGAARLPAFTGGDVSSTAGSTALNLSNTGIVAGTYAKVTIDAKGRATAGASLSAADITTATGYTAVNRAGDTMTGSLNLPSNGLAVGTNELVVSSGRVGIGTAAAPPSTLYVNGSAASATFNNGSLTTFDLSKANTQFTSASCGNMTLNNMVDGAVYSLAIQGATSGLCQFTDSAGSRTFKFVPANSATTAGTHSVYTMIVVGNFVYVTWISGF